MRALIFDTETTGKFDFKAPFDAAHQPHLVQLCAILQGHDGEIVSELNLIIRPDGWVIPAEAAAIHRITQDIAASYGVRLANAVYAFRDMMESADVAVAHNIAFDTKIIRRALAEGDVEPLPWERIPQRCTMMQSTGIVKASGPRGFKWPTLAETHTHFFGTGVDGAHNASADTHACRRIYNALVERKAFPAIPGVN